MDDRVRGFGVLAGFLCVSLALIAAGFRLKDDSNSSLYCVSRGSSFVITTLNHSLPEANCFRIQNGKFTEILGEPPPGNEHITFLDGYVLPGLIDSHGHILQYGEMLESVSLHGASSIEEVRTRIKDFLKAHEGQSYGSRQKWVRGIGWDQAHFGGAMPTAKELGDPALADLYIMLDRVDVHCVWLSQKVLGLLPEPLPEAPPGGVIVKDPGLGVFCDNAMDVIVYPFAPKPDTAQKTRWFKAAMHELNKVGIVGVGDAGMRADDVSILESMAEKQELSIRINVMLECAERNTYCPSEIRGLKLLDFPAGLGSSNLMLGGVKLFADGALGSWGAALLDPYTDKEETSGTMLINEAELTRVVKDWFDAGFQVNIHAIGDRANRAAVDAFEFVLGSNVGSNSERRLRIEHAQIIHPEDQLRIANMGVIPSIQPTHATSDMTYASSRLGPERLQHSAYKMASLFPSEKSAISLYPGPVFGSDFPVEPPNPFHGMYAAVTRLNPATGTSPDGESGWYPAETVSVEKALLAFTRNAAYGWFQEEKLGGIDVGKWADFVVVDTNIFDEGGSNLRKVMVKETWVGGEKVYAEEMSTKEKGAVPYLEGIIEYARQLLVRLIGDPGREL